MFIYAEILKWWCTTVVYILELGGVIALIVCILHGLASALKAYIRRVERWHP